MFKAMKGIPAQALIKAGQILEMWQRGEAAITHLKRSGSISLKVGIRWRLLSRDNGDTWDLLTHERYNREKDK